MKNEIIEMAVKAGIAKEVAEVNIDIMEAFAKLVAEAEKERIAKKIEQLPFGDTAQSFAIFVRNDL